MSTQDLAFAAIVAMGAWLVAAGLLMALRPGRALAILGRTASTRFINNVEQGLRLSAGVVLVVRAPFTSFPLAFQIGGGFIAASSLILLVVPLKWHASYAIWWARRLPPWAVRAIAPVSVLAGVGLVGMAR